MGQFQTKSTHIANATDEDVYVRVDSERPNELKSGQGIKFTGKHVSVGLSGSQDLKWENFINTGFAKISPRTHLRTSPNVQGGRGVFISVGTKSQGLIWNNVQQEEDASFIVRKRGGTIDIVKSVYGNIWEVQK